MNSTFQLAKAIDAAVQRMRPWWERRSTEEKSSMYADGFDWMDYFEDPPSKAARLALGRLINEWAQSL